MLRTGRRTKHIPERSCLACRRKKAKCELTRIVRTAEGGVEIDPRGKKAGRGAYLCRVRECWVTGLKRRTIERALKSEISGEQLSQLLAYGETLPTSVGGQDEGA